MSTAALCAGGHEHRTPGEADAKRPLRSELARPDAHEHVSGEWQLNWYFNFHNFRGLAFHEFDLPGVPASHACVRLLARDASGSTSGVKAGSSTPPDNWRNAGRRW